MFAITKNNHFVLKYPFIFICFIMINRYIQSIEINIQESAIVDYKDIQINLNSTNNYIIYKYNINIDKKDFILQLNSISNIPITIYFYNNNTLNYEESGDFSNWDKEYISNVNDNKNEFLFQANKKVCYIIFTIKKTDKRNYTDYTGNFIIFGLPVDISLNDYFVNQSYFYYTYNNNYTLENYNNNYNYRINSYNLNYNKNEIYLHCIVQSKGKNYVFINNGDNEVIYDKNNISYLDYYLNITRNVNTYNIQLIAEKNIPFSIYFEILYENNKINYIGNNNTICNNILGEATYYFYDEISISNINEPLYYLVNDNLSENVKKVRFYNPTEFIDLKKVTNEELYQIALNGVYTPMTSKNKMNNINIYKYNNESKNMTNNIIFIQIIINNFQDLNLDKICIKKIPLVKLNIESIEFHKIIYNNTNQLDNIGYIPDKNFYASNIYKEVLESNSLKLFNFSNDIQSIDINFTQPSIYNNNIFFQGLLCGNSPETEISLFYSHNNESDYKKHDILLTKLSTNNFYGIINLKEIDNTNYYFNIFLPQKMYFKYLYFENNYFKYNNSYLCDDNVENSIEIEKSGNKMIITFDAFNIKETTNYTILVKNQEEEKILNECQFISFLSSNNKKYYIYNYIDKGNSQKVKIKIDLQDFGNYDIYILAQGINDFSLYKFIGYKEFIFTKNKNDDDKSNKTFINFLIISNAILVLVVIGFIAYLLYKKRKKKNLINSVNISLLDKDTSQSSQLNTFNKENEKSTHIATENSGNISNDNSINVQESNFNILNKEFPIFNGSINDLEENKFKNNIIVNNKEKNNDNKDGNTEKGNNNNDVNDQNNDEDISESAAPAYDFIKTQNPEENIIGNIFAEKNNVKDVIKEDDAIKKVFVNVDTTKGL